MEARGKASVFTGARGVQTLAYDSVWDYPRLSADAKRIIVSSPERGLAWIDVATGATTPLPGAGGSIAGVPAALPSGAALALFGRRDVALWHPGDWAPQRLQTDCDAYQVEALGATSALFYCDAALESIDMESGVRRLLAFPEARKSRRPGTTPG